VALLEGRAIGPPLRRPASAPVLGVAAKTPQRKLEHYRGVEYVPAMLDVDGKPFGAGCVGALTLALTYIAGSTAWALLGVPLLVMVAYYLAFQPPSPDQGHRGQRTGVRSSCGAFRAPWGCRSYPCRTAGLFSRPAGGVVLGSCLDVQQARLAATSRQTRPNVLLGSGPSKCAVSQFESRPY
jgi:hypothetical protein